MEPMVEGEEVTKAVHLKSLALLVAHFPNYCSKLDYVDNLLVKKKLVKNVVQQARIFNRQRRLLITVGGIQANRFMMAVIDRQQSEPLQILGIPQIATDNQNAECYPD